MSKKLLIALGILPFVSVSPIRAQIASQVAYSNPQAAVYSLAVPFAKPEVAGDLNVVVVGWRDASAKVLSLSDSNGNQYQLAGGSATLGANLLSQSDITWDQTILIHWTCSDTGDLVPFRRKARSFNLS